MRNLFVGSASFSSYKYTAFWGKQCKKLFFYDFEERKGREMEGKRVGKRIEISNFIRKRWDVFRVVFTSQRVHIVVSLYLVYT
jgi:hypothetical protein